MSTLAIDRLTSVRAVLIDMDGVIYIGDHALPGAQDLLDYLDNTGRQWLFVTNNSTRTPEMFVEKVHKMGIRAKPHHILTSALATASWMGEEFPQGGKVFVVGQAGLRQALIDEGFTLVEDPFEAEFVAAAIHFELTYQMVADATLAIRNGAKFIGTNIDPSFPSERGQIPGTGAVLALLEAASGVSPEIIGKPFPGMFRQAMHKLGTETETTLMVGDRYETDIAGAIDLGMPTVAVTTGINSRDDFEQADPPPELILDDVPALIAAFREADGNG